MTLSTSATHIQNAIVACIDGSISATGVCHASAWCAKTLGSPVLALHVLDRHETPALADLTGAIGLGAREHLLKELAELDHQRAKLAREEGKIMLDAAQDALGKDQVEQIEMLQLHASLPEALEELKDQTRVVVIGRQGKSHQSASESVGSQLETIVRTSHHPVWVTPSQFTPPTQCVIAYDASPTAKRMIDRLCTSPLLHHLSAKLVMVGSPSLEEQSALTECAAKLAKAGHQVSPEIISGDPLIVLQDLAQARDTLLVMGAYGHSRIREFLVGSTTTETVRKAKSSVVLIR